MRLRILKIKQPVEHIHGETLTEKIEFPIEWAGQNAFGDYSLSDSAGTSKTGTVGKGCSCLGRILRPKK